MKDLIERESEIKRKGEELMASFEAIAQGRSDFALEHFVVGQHDTPARQWAQAILELQVKVFNTARVMIDRERIVLRLEELRDSLTWRVRGRQRRRIELDIAEAETNLRELELGRLGQVREAETLYAIASKLEQECGPFTHEILQAEEASYWHLRLERQLLTGMRAEGHPGQGDIEAVLQTIRPLGAKPIPLLPPEELRALVALAAHDHARLLEEAKK